MEGINKKYNIEIEVLTPLSIGAGAEKDWVRGVDFVVDNRKIYKLNLKKMVSAGLRSEELSNFFVNKNEEGLKSKLAGKLDDVSDVIIPCPAESDNDVKAFVKNQMTGKPVLVGSSLKGAIRSVLFDYLGGTSKNGQEVFGSSTDGDEFMRFIKISDAEFDKTSLVNTKIFNLQKKSAWQGGWKNKNETSSDYRATEFNTLYESLVPGQVGVALLMMSEVAYNKFGKEKQPHKKDDKKRPILSNGITELCKIINKHTKRYLEKEKAFFKKYATDRTDEIVESIDNLLKQIPQDNSYCILKMSAGAGFHSITGDWQFEDYSINHVTLKRNGGTDKSFGVDKNGQDAKSAKSRKIAVYGNSMSLMGFVKLKPISDEEVAKRKQEVEQREQERLAEIQRQKEAKEREKREAEERQARYNSLIAEAKKLESEEKYENALAKANEAKELLPNGREHEYLVSQIQYKVNEIKAKREAETEKQREQQQIEANKQKRLDAGFAFLLERKVNSEELKILELSNGIKRIKQFLDKNSDYSLTESDMKSMREWLNTIPVPTKKADKKDFETFSEKSWSYISNIIGDDTAKRWFEEIKK